MPYKLAPKNSGLTFSAPPWCYVPGGEAAIAPKAEVKVVVPQRYPDPPPEKLEEDPYRKRTAPMLLGIEETASDAGVVSPPHQIRIIPEIVDYSLTRSTLWIR